MAVSCVIRRVGRRIADSRTCLPLAFCFVPVDLFDLSLLFICSHGNIPLPRYAPESIKRIGLFVLHGVLFVLSPRPSSNTARTRIACFVPWVRNIAPPLPCRKPCRAEQIPVRVTKRNKSELFRAHRVVRICFLLLNYHIDAVSERGRATSLFSFFSVSCCAFHSANSLCPRSDSKYATISGRIQRAISIRR